MLHVPFELQIDIFSYLSVQDISTFAQCNKECKDLAYDPFLWYKLIYRDWYKIKQPYVSKDYRLIYIRYTYLDMKFVKSDSIDDWIFYCYKYDFEDIFNAASEDKSLLCRKPTYEQLLVLFDILEETWETKYRITGNYFVSSKIVGSCVCNNKHYYIVKDLNIIKYYSDQIRSHCKAGFFNKYCRSSNFKSLDHVKFVSKYIFDIDAWLLDILSYHRLKLDTELLKYILDKVGKERIFYTPQRCLWIITKDEKSLEKIKLLFQYIDNPNEYCMRYDTNGNNIFNCVTNIGVLEYIINSCGNFDEILNMRHFKDRTILFFCSAEIADLLLKKSNNPEHFCNIRDSDGQTALFRANFEKIKVLFLYVTDINAYCCTPDNHGSYALHTNCNDEKIITLILDNVHDADEYCRMTYNYGRTAAFNCTNLKCILLMLKYIKDKNAFCYMTDFYGDTFLLIILKNYQKWGTFAIDTSIRDELVNLLLSTIGDDGSYLLYKNNSGKCAKDYL